MKKTTFNIIVITLIITLFSVITISGLATQTEPKAEREITQTEILTIWKLSSQGVIK